MIDALISLVICIVGNVISDRISKWLNGHKSNK